MCGDRSNPRMGVKHDAVHHTPGSVPQGKTYLVVGFVELVFGVPLGQYELGDRKGAWQPGSVTESLHR